MSIFVPIEPKQQETTKQDAATEDIHVLSQTKLEIAINKARKMLVRQDKEKMIVLNAKGVSILETDGVSFNVFFDDETAKKIANATVTHNHPSGKNATGVLRFGYSLSSDDVYEAIRCNARGIIAEAPYYRYSIERPIGGWRVDADVVRERYSEIYSEIKKMHGDSLINHHAENIIQHLTIKQLAKEFGIYIQVRKEGLVFTVEFISNVLVLFQELQASFFNIVRVIFIDDYK